MNNDVVINNIIEELQWRNLLKDISNIEKVINAGKLGKGIYCGVDPTSDSLHLGNLLQIMLLYRFACFGFQPIVLIGGTTAMIGDPSGKNQERVLLSEKILQNNVKKITAQINSLVTYQPITNLTSLELITKHQLLNDKDCDTLNMIIKSINPNEQYLSTLRLILAKLPLPWEELNLPSSLMIKLYEVCQLNQTWLLVKNNLAKTSFKSLLSYCNSWVQTWIEFSALPIGKINEKIKPIKIINNQSWLNSFSLITFLRDIGKNFNINQMLSKEMVVNRLETGISYTEFSYMILQAYDFYYLYEKEDCYLQSGGSDQWGNITTGLDLIRKQKGDNHGAAGITIKLLTKENGQKFGKSEQGAIFLDSSKTSTYDCYQFLLNQNDNELLSLFNALTFFNQTQIGEILTIHQTNLKQHYGQKILAAVLTTFIHQLDGYFSAMRITNALFHDQIYQIKATEIRQVLKDVPHFYLTNDETLLNVLVANQICGSKRIARELIAQGSIMINGNKINQTDFNISKNDAINKTFTIIKKGKKHYYLILHQ